MDAGVLREEGRRLPRLTAEVLLAHALSCDRVRLYLDFDKPLGDPELAIYRDLVRRCGEGEPTAYLVGEKEFYGRLFAVDARVLVPRPETELLVDAALAALPRSGRLLDLCTGSGAIAITVALERPDARVLATDASEDALAVAREREPAPGRSSSPTGTCGRRSTATSASTSSPRIRHTCRCRASPGLAREVRREPCIALDGGQDGLAILRRIVADAPARLRPRRRARPRDARESPGRGSEALPAGRLRARGVAARSRWPVPPGGGPHGGRPPPDVESARLAARVPAEGPRTSRGATPVAHRARARS